MAVLTGRINVPAPNPITPRYGLFQTVTGPLDLPMHARIGGLQYEISTCDLPFAYEVECQADLGDKTITGSQTVVLGDPFVVYSTFTCSAVGLANYGPERLRRFLYDQLIAGEQAVVERTFSEGTFGLAPSLSNNPAVVDLGTATDMINGIGVLEEWLYGRYGLPGIIHAPIITSPYYSNFHTFDMDPEGHLADSTKTAVSFGNYAGTGPTGQVPAAGFTYLYITGQMAVWRTPDSELFIPPMGQVLNRATDVITSVMEREYVLAFDCHIASVLVPLDPSP